MQNGKVTIGLIQMRVEDDREAMLKKALARVEEAVKAGADIICLPELYRTRYFPQHIGTNAFPCAETVPGESTHFFSRIAKEHQVVIIVPLYEKAPDGNYYNSAVVINTDGTTNPPYPRSLILSSFRRSMILIFLPSIPITFSPANAERVRIALEVVILERLAISSRER